jgi:hypothetical protein
MIFFNATSSRPRLATHARNIPYLTADETTTTRAIKTTHLIKPAHVTKNDYHRHRPATGSTLDTRSPRDTFPLRLPMPTSRSFALSALSLLVLFVLTVYPSALLADQGFQPVSADELKVSSEPQAPGAAAIILFRQVDRYDDPRVPHEDNYLRIKILTEEGRRYGDVEIPFFKQSQDVIHIRARTIRPDGSIANFDGQVFEKSIVKSKSLKYLAKTFTLPDVQVGGIIEYFYTVDLKEHYIFDSHWIISDELFTKNARFTLRPYINERDNLILRWSWQSLPRGSEPKQDNDQYHTVRMDVSNIPAFQTEDFMPPANELKSRVDFNYTRDLYSKDAETFWKRIGKERNEELESFIGKRKAMEEAVTQIVSANDPPETKLRKIYARVQQLRNTSYELQKTEQEEKRDKEKNADNVENVLKRGYGTGVQLTWLFLALARAAGFEAYGCWVSDRSQYFFSPTLMHPEKLDANVALVKLNGKDLYFDPGAAFTPFGLLDWPETGTPGLRLDKNGGTWITTTLPESSDSRIQRSAKLKINDTGDLEGAVTVTYTGLEAMSRRREFRHADDVTRKKSLEDDLREQIPAAVEADLTNKPDWSGSETPLIAEFQIKVPGWVAAAGKRAVMPAAIFTAGEKTTFEHARRTHSIYFEYPFEKIDDVTVELPPGWQVSSVPNPLSDDGHVVTYSLKIDSAKDSLRMQRKLGVDFLILETKYYPSLQKFFQTVRTQDEQQIVLQPGAATAKN